MTGWRPVFGKKWSTEMSEIAQKWGDSVARRGFAQIPNYLLLINQFLDEDSRLPPVELLLLIELVGTWWKREELPFPSIKTLAVRCGVSDRQVQRAVGNLERRGLLKRTKRRSNNGIIASNAYDMKPATLFLEEVARMFPNEYPRRIEQLNLKDFPVPLPR
jgi:hypothetical protein